MVRKHSTLWLALQLLRLHFSGWRQVPGYTCAQMEGGGGIYFAVQLQPLPQPTPHDN